MQNSLFKVFGSVKLIQEVTRSSNQPESTSSDEPPTIVNKPKIETTLLNSHKLLEQKQPQPLYIPASQSCWSASQPIPLSFTTFNTPNLLSYKPRDIKTLFSNTNARKSHTRHNSKYTVRHYRHRSTANRKQNRPLDSKNKSHKLLCLWPLPILTQYLILVSLVVSTLNALHILQLTSSAPSFVIYRLDFLDLFLSPFLFHFTLPSIALFGWNVLVLGLFEESLTHLVGGTKRFSLLLLSFFLSVLGVRNLLGFLFSKSTGWALPFLFFSNSMHESNEGISPFLFALLVVQSLCMDDKYILIYGQEDSNHQMTIHKVLLQLIMCLVNFCTGNRYWWSISGLLTGFIMTLILQIVLAREKREGASQVKDAADFITLESYCRTPLWRLVWPTLQTSLAVVGCTWGVLYLLNTYYTQERPVSPAQLNTLSQDPYLFTLVFMTAPRRGDPAYLTETLQSYLHNWPERPESPYDRMQAIVYTHFSHHTQYDLAQARFSSTAKGQQYLRWEREEGSDWNQRLHVSKALELATRYNSTYYALMEDDFPVCGVREWHEIEKVIYKANQQVPQHCGVFVGTGGSGLFLKPHIAKLTSELLLKYVDMPPDIIIQKCLLGELDECSECKETLVTSKTLLMYHIGYNTSTSDDRVYKKDEFQCGWRHPFNGDPSVITL